MGKRNQKSTVIVKRSGETDERKICIGEEINRWTTVREALSLSDEELLKAMLDLLEDRRVCPHGCYMKNTPNTSKPAKAQPKIVRTVGTQTKSKRKTLATQTDVVSKDAEAVIGSHSKPIINEGQIKDNQSKPQEEQTFLLNQSAVTEDVRWKALKTSQGLKTDGQVLKTLLDWYMNTQSIAKLKQDRPPPSELSQNKESSPVPNSSYLLTLSVTPDQEQAIKNLCLLREWPFTKYSPLVDQTEAVSKEYKASPVPFFEESSTEQEFQSKSTPESLVTQPIRTVRVQDLGPAAISLKERSVVDLAVRSGEANVTAVSVLGETTVASTIDTSLLSSVTVTETTHVGQNVYIPLQQADFRGRESGTIYKQMDIQRSEDDIIRREHDDVYKSANSELMHERASQMPYALPGAVALESMGIFPKTTASLTASSSPFNTTHLDYDQHRRKIDDTDSSVADQKYKKIRLTEPSRSVSFPAGAVSFPTGGGQEAAEEQYSQIHNGANVGYSYIQTGYPQGQ